MTVRREPGRRRVFARVGATVVLLLALGLMGAVTGAGAVRSAGGGRTGLFVIHKPTAHVLATPSATKPHWVCPTSLCDAIVEPRPSKRGSHSVLPDGIVLEGSGEEGGLDPADLRSAYKIPASGGSGQTVAVIEEGGYATAESDLAKYRSRYGLPPCPKSTGCFKQVNGKGEEANYPSSEGTEGEAGLDLDMASAACPECKLMIVEVEPTLTLSELGAGVSEAAALGAGEVSVSYGEAELAVGKVQEQAQFNSHPGVVITAASGDEGYDDEDRNKESSPSWPANQEDVIAVGGTALKRAADSRGWSESVWRNQNSNLVPAVAALPSRRSRRGRKPTFLQKDNSAKARWRTTSPRSRRLARPCPHTS